MDTTHITVNGEPIPECRQAPHASKLDRIVAGIRSVADDLELDLPDVDIRPILRERLLRIAAEAENLSSRDLLRMSPLAIAHAEVA